MNKAKSPDWLATFVENYEGLSTNNLHLIQKIYHQDVIFQDPAHCLIGLDKLEDYFASLYTNLSNCSFSIDKVLLDGEEAAIYWTMDFCHSKLNRGKPVLVEGTSLIKGKEGKVIQHRDYVDLGAMLYEHIPVLGGIVKTVKKRLSK